MPETKKKRSIERLFLSIPDDNSGEMHNETAFLIVLQKNFSKFFLKLNFSYCILF